MVGEPVEPVNKDFFLFGVLSDVVQDSRPDFLGENMGSMFCSPESVDPDSNLGHGSINSGLKPGCLCFGLTST